MRCPLILIATCGKPSLFFSTPAYQEPLGVASRTIPDVSYNAAINGGVLVANSTVLGGVPEFFVVGGTSAATPQWAAIMALANQAAGQPLGFVNPDIYALAQSGYYSSDFHDITVGNKANTNVRFSGGTGWDAATGGEGRMSLT